MWCVLGVCGTGVSTLNPEREWTRVQCEIISKKFKRKVMVLKEGLMAEIRAMWFINQQSEIQILDKYMLLIV